MSKSVVFVSSLLFVIPGIILTDAAFLALGITTFSLFYALSDYQRDHILGITLMTMFMIRMVITGGANFLGFMAQGTPSEDQFFMYAAENYLFSSMLILYLGIIFTAFGFSIINKGVHFPVVEFYADKEKIIRRMPVIILLIIGVKFFNLMPSIGTITAFLKFLPVAGIFLLSRLGGIYQDSRFIRASTFLTIIETIRAVLFEMLRMHMILPAIAYSLGILIGNRSLKPLKSPRFVLLYVIALVFILFFQVMGAVRGKSWGVDRLSRITQIISKENENDPGGASFVGRLTNFNQLSQVSKLADQEGFYDGSTLSYLSYVFIPRFIWPDKPTLDKGQWFALKIGEAYQYESGRINNSINMTIPGELYLNFGYIGVVLGSTVFGMFLAMVWNALRFWQASNNIFGNLFGFYLLFLGLFSLGSDLMFVVSLVAIYLLFYALTVGLLMVPRK